MHGSSKQHSAHSLGSICQTIMQLCDEATENHGSLVVLMAWHKYWGWMDASMVVANAAKADVAVFIS